MRQHRSRGRIHESLNYWSRVDREEKYEALQSKKYQRSKKHHTPPQSHEGGRSNPIPPTDQAENRTLKVLQKHPLCARTLESKIPKSIEKMPKLGEHDEKGYPGEYVQIVNDRLNYFYVDEASKCKLFALTLVSLPGCGLMVF